tara:strand:- start:1060 stop:1503 length:444 start_codon:yes stop_codon:yes gene_type:complete
MRKELTKSQERKKKSGLCIKKFCRGKACDRKGFKCHKCYRNDFKERDPASVAYSALKQNVKARNKPFNLTLDEFREFCRANDYLSKSGRMPDNLQVDRIRIDDPRGYHKDNIQALSQKLNGRKYHDYERFGQEAPEYFGEPESDLPF